MKKLILLPVFFLCICCVFAAPDKFYNLDGKGFSYQEIVFSPKTVLFFWTSQCPYCIRSFNHMNENTSLFDGVNVYFINLGEDGRVVSRVAKYLKLKDTIVEKILLDRQDFFSDEFTIIGVPTYIFLSKGKVIARTYYVDEALLGRVFKE
ncbi:MAG: TlpA disulfide reductase family protein [Candidatus Omnitrophota bacterium]|nr:TlpA disulfide reductase family protein [Candidatus Omnitrophota bacterium]